MHGGSISVRHDVWAGDLEHVGNVDWIIADLCTTLEFRFCIYIVGNLIGSCCVGLVEQLRPVSGGPACILFSGTAGDAANFGISQVVTVRN